MDSPDPAEFDIEAAMFAASLGDGEALQLLALGTMIVRNNGYVAAPHQPPLSEVLIVGETFARLAAMGDEPEAMLLLASILVVRSDDLAPHNPARAAALWEEAAGLLHSCALQGHAAATRFLIEELQRRADAGSEQDAIWLNNIIEAVPPETLAEARKPETAQAA